MAGLALLAALTLAPQITRAVDDEARVREVFTAFQMALKAQDTSKLWKLPFLRGLALLAEQMHLGMKTLIWSAGVNAGDQVVMRIDGLGEVEAVFE